MDEPKWASVQLSADRLPGHLLFRRAEVLAGAESPRRGRSGAPAHLRKARHPACGAGDPAGVERPRVAVDAVFDGLRRHHFQGEARRRRASSSARSPRRCRSIPNWSGNISARWCPTPTILRGAQLGGVHRRLVRLRAARACAARWSCRPISASTPRNRAVRAHADRRRRRRSTSATSKAAPRRCATKISCTPRWSNWSRWTTPQIKYSTVQNWYPGDKNGKGGIYNFVTKRGECRGAKFEDLLDAGRDRLGHHLEISELHPAGRQLGRRILFRGAHQQLPAGRHRHEDDPHRQEHASTIVSKGISAGHGQNTYRGLVKIHEGADRTRAITRSAIRC